MKFRSALVLMACGIAAACGGDDDPTEPTGVSGSIAFSYLGAGAANATAFNASGAIPLSVGGQTNSNNLGTNPWAAGAFSTTQNYAVVGGVIPKTSNTWDIAQIIVNRSTVGTSQITVDCTDPEVTTCTGMFLTMGLNPNGDTLASLCYLTAGSVTISAISTANITGTFSGTGTCYNGLTAAESPFTVTNGTFNVGVTSQLLL